MRILVCNYTGFRENWGSQATSRALLQFLCSILPEGHPIQVDILPYPPTHWLDHWQSKRYGTFLEDIYATPFPTKTQLDLLETLTEARFGDFLDRVKAADVVFFQGEGALGSGREFRRTQLFGPLLLARHRYEKITVSINQSVVFRSAHAERALQSIFGSLDRNYVRELDSLSTCKAEGWTKFGFIPDAALFYRPSQANVTGDHGPYFCITGSADFSSYDLEAYARGIQEVAGRWNLHPVFVYSRNSDAVMVEAFKKLGNQAFSIVTSATHPDVDQMLPVLAGAQLVIGGRYHSSISALSQNVPVILTASNSRKSIGLSQMFGAENVPLLDNPTPHTLTAEVHKLMENREALRRRLSRRLEDLEQTARTAAEELKAYLSVRVRIKHQSGHAYFPALALADRSNGFKLLRTVMRSKNLDHYDRRKLVLPVDRATPTSDLSS